MNKNWFYRVLALALVAMLAVPMFAFAEEDVLATAAEAPAEELTTALEGEDEIEPKVTLTATGVIDVELGHKVTEWLPAFELNNDRFVSINLTNANGKKETFKSSNRKVATVSADGTVFFVGVGSAVITCSGYVDGFKKPLTTKIGITVIDLTDPAYLAGYFGTSEFLDAGETLLADKDELEGLYPGFGFIVDDVPTMYYHPVAFNAAHEWIGAGSAAAGANTLGLEYERGFHFKWSNSKIAFFDGFRHVGFPAAPAPTNFGTTGSPVGGPYVSAAKFWMGGAVARDDLLMPVFYKPGKVKLTIKTEATAGLKAKSYTNTFVIEKAKRNLSDGNDKDIQQVAKKNGSILFQLGSIDIQSMDKVVLTIKVYNGTGWQIPLSGVKFAASVEDSVIGVGAPTPFLQYGYDGNDIGLVKRNNSVKGGSIKPNKTTTITLTFENKRDANWNIRSLSGYVFDATTVNNVVTSRANALEIMSPYPDVWDEDFMLTINNFEFDGIPGIGTLSPSPVYPTTGGGTSWIINP